MKGVSNIMSAVILILIVMGIAVTVGPWMMDIVSDVMSGTSTATSQDLICRQTAYDFDSDYGTKGVNLTYSGTTTATLTSRIVNRGTQNIYNFSFELTMQTPAGSRLILSPEINVTNETQKTKSDPVKPGESWTLNATITNVNSTWSLLKVKIINQACPKVFSYVSF